MVSGKESTLKRYIQAYENDDMTYPKFFYRQVHQANNDVRYVVNEDCILDDFFAMIEDYILPYTMTDEEFRKYKYNPKAFSYYLYGTTEFWHLLLDINEMYSGLEFDKREINVMTQSIRDFINTTLKNSKQYIDENEADVSAALLAPD